MGLSNIFQTFKEYSPILYKLYKWKRKKIESPPNS